MKSSFDLSADYGGFRLEARAAWDAPRAALFGASGSGKTTLVEAIAGLRPEVSGSVVLRGRRLDGLPARSRRVGWVPQEAALFPHLSVRSNLAFASRGRDAAEVERAVEALEIGDLLDRGAGTLSGGERQRVAVARALASGPDFLLLDEPLSSVDRPLRARLAPFLGRLTERSGIPMLLVTHDPLEVAALTDHVLVLDGGRIVSAGPSRGVFASPNAFAALSLGAENRFEVRVEGGGGGGGTLELRTAGGTRLTMVKVAGFPPPRRIAVRAEDIMLSAGPPGRVSAQNVLEARVEGLDGLGSQVDVRLDVGGERWRSKVTPEAVRSLGLEPGTTVHMLIKAHALLGST